MAIQNYNFNSSDYVLSGSKRVITCTSTNVAEPKFRFYLEVIYDSKTYAYTFRPNNLGYGLIDISSILQSIVYPISVQQVLTVPASIETTGTTNYFQQNIHSMPHQKYSSGYVEQIFSTGGTGAKKIELKLWDFYAASSSAAPSKQGSAVTDDMYMISGYTKSTDLINTDFSDYKLTTTTKSFLSGNYNLTDSIRSAIDVSMEDFGTLSFLNRTASVNTTAETQYVVINYYTAAGVEISRRVLTQSEIYGGEYDASGVDGGGMIITVGCYPANLNKMATDRPADQVGLAYYYVSASSASGGTHYSKLYRFNMVTRCDKFDTQRLAYINKFGVWEYITFDKKREDKISNKRKEIKTSIYNYGQSYANTATGYNEKPFVPGVAHESRKNVASNVKQSFKIHTGYLPDYKIEQVRDLFISSQIHYINEDGTALAIILMNNSIDEVVVSHKHEQTEYALDFEYSIETYNPILL